MMVIIIFVTFVTKHCETIECQSVAKKLFVEDLPKPFESIKRLERLLASRRILFNAKR